MTHWRKRSYMQKSERKQIARYHEELLEEMKQEQQETRENLRVLSEKIDDIYQKVEQSQESIQGEIEDLSKLVKTLLINSLLDEMEEELRSTRKRPK